MDLGKMKWIETLNYEGENYKPVLITNKWQIAYLNSCLEYELKSIKKVDIHHKTDEAFVLLEGKAVLIAAEIEQDKIKFELIIMEEGTTYNIPKGVWHNIVLYDNTRVCIIEDANTHLGDFEFYHFSEEETQQLHNKVRALFLETNI